jgi:hypothetical protein
MHWSIDETCAAAAAEAEAGPGPEVAVAEPPPLTPVERIAEILERFYLEDARLTRELVQELGKSDAESLVR